jgi:hypothetical protein
MADTTQALTFDGVPAAVHEPLKLLAEHLRVKLAANLAGLTVVGSSLTDDYVPGRSDINTVVTLERYETAALKAIAGLARPLRKTKVSAPLLMTADYIQRSRDVFGVEFLDLRLTHRTVLGDDPFAKLRVRKRDVRLQCERELKATLIRLRQGYIAAAGNTKLIRDVLIAAAKSMAPLLRAMLWLKGLDRPQTTAPTFEQAAATFDVYLDAVVAAEHWRHEKTRMTDNEIETAFESVYEAVDKLATIVDAQEV